MARKAGVTLHPPGLGLPGWSRSGVPAGGRVNENVLKQLRGTIDEATQRARRSAPNLAFLMCDELMEHNYLIRDKLKGWINQLEAEITESVAPLQVAHLYAVSRIAEHFVGALDPFKGALDPAAHDGATRRELLSDVDVVRADLVADLGDYMAQVTQMLSHSKELLTLYKTLMDERMNRILNILTLVTSAFLPAQFMSGLYGMNFVNIPELELKWGYYAWWGIVLFLSANVIGYFKRNRLI